MLTTTNKFMKTFWCRIRHMLREFTTSCALGGVMLHTLIRVHIKLEILY